MNNRIIFDTETISLEKAFCYNLGYIITDENGKTLIARNFIIRQIYDNKPLFATAYYAQKRPIYTAYLKGKKAVKIMLNAKNPEDIKSVVELGASTVLTPYLDEIIKNLAKTLGVL